MENLERKQLLQMLDSSAYDVTQDMRQAEEKLHSLAQQKRYLARLTKEFSFTDDMGIYLRIIYEDETNPKDDENSRLVKAAIELINSEYEKSKYEGRDAKAFFRTLFGRADTSLTLALEKSL